MYFSSFLLKFPFFCRPLCESPESQSISPPPVSLPSENTLSPRNSPSNDINQNSISVEINIEDVRLSINALLDAVDALKSISEVHNSKALLTTASNNEPKSTQPQFAERRTTTKHSRKSRLQHRIVPAASKPFIATNTNSIPPLEYHINDRSLSPISNIPPLRPLSISPARFVSNIFILSIRKF